MNTTNKDLVKRNMKLNVNFSQSSLLSCHSGIVDSN